VVQTGRGSPLGSLLETFPLGWEVQLIIKSRHRNQGRLAPDVFERLRRHRGVAHGVRNAGVSEIVLEASSIHSTGRQSVARRVPEHVNVNWERQLGGFASSLDHATNSHAAERLGLLGAPAAIVWAMIEQSIPGGNSTVEIFVNQADQTASLEGA
jgi:hypothetical protein